MKQQQSRLRALVGRVLVVLLALSGSALSAHGWLTRRRGARMSTGDAVPEAPPARTSHRAEGVEPVAGSRATRQPKAPPEAPPATGAVALDDPATAFTRQRATRWLDPGLLLRSAGEAVVSGLLGQYTDKREVMGALPADPPLDLRSRNADLWVDYVADTGDGFDATYAVARLLAQPDLATTADGRRLMIPRGRLLVMGGDQCYPSAHVRAYEDRLIGPYRAALPQVTSGEPPYLLVVPGNHDWYDGLTSFMRTFCQGRWLGGWRTRQSRSYFAAKLPGRWWLWGIDIQFDTYIDDVQRRYFEQVATELEPDDAVVLCSAKPSWVATGEDDLEAYATLDFIDRTVIRPTGARLRVCLSGDRHHYARYEAADGAQKVTAGGGGAYLSPTHHLPQKLEVPPARSRARGRSAPTVYECRAVFPDHAQSRRLGWGVLRLPWTTPAFTAFMGAVQTTLALTMIWALSPELRALPDRLRLTADALRQSDAARLASALADSLSTVVLAAAVVFAAVAFTKNIRSTRGWLAGGVHGLLHLGVAVLTTYAAALVAAPLPGRWILVGVLPLVFVVGGLLATEVVALYLLLADRWRLNSNELFAAQSIPHYKNFLRLHVDADGDLTIYPIGVRRVPRKWERRDGSADAPSCLDPVDGSLSPLLIEPPVRVSPVPAGVATPAGTDR